MIPTRISSGHTYATIGIRNHSQHNLDIYQYPASRQAAGASALQTEKTKNDQVYYRMKNRNYDEAGVDILSGFPCCVCLEGREGRLDKKKVRRGADA